MKEFQTSSYEESRRNIQKYIASIYAAFGVDPEVDQGRGRPEVIKHRFSELGEIGLRKALDMLTNSPHAEEFVKPDGQDERPVHERLLEVVSGILQSEGVPIIDNRTDKDIPILNSGGRTVLRTDSGDVPFNKPELRPRLVENYLRLLNTYPDLVMIYRFGGTGLSLERPNIAYDPLKGKVESRNPRFIRPISIGMGG